MKSMLVKTLKSLKPAIAILTLFASIICAATLDRGNGNGVNFQVVVDKLVYSPGSMISVKFIVTNTGEGPLYIPRSLSECSNIEGVFVLQILDQSDHNLTSKGCSSDVGPAWETHVIEQVVDSKLWIALQPGEIFGKSSAFELPTKKGVFRLKAEITPPGFTDEQRVILKQRNIRVLQNPCPAPVVTITVK